MFANFADSINKQHIKAYELVKEESDFVNAKVALEHRKVSTAHKAIFNARKDQVCGMIQSSDAVHKAKLEILFLNFDFFDAHFTQVFERFEGMACSCDKSRTCLSLITKYLVSNEPIKFNYEGEYTFHLPEFVLTTHEQVMFYFDALASLVYGKFDGYLTALQRLSEQKFLNSREEINPHTHTINVGTETTSHSHGDNGVITK